MPNLYPQRTVLNVTDREQVIPNALNEHIAQSVATAVEATANRKH